MQARAASWLYAHWASVLAWLLLALLSSSLFREAAQPAQLYVDEAEWINSGRVAFDLLRPGASPQHWAESFDPRRLGAWGNLNPPVGKYIIGAAVTPELTAD